MGTKERREREKETRRKAILDAAERVFFARGLEKATMDEVAEEAEFSKGTIYLYFKNKEDLYLAIIARGSAILKSLFLRAQAEPGSGLEKVCRIGEAYCEFARAYPDYFNAMLYFESTEFERLVADSPSAQACWCLTDEIFAIVIDALKQGMADGSVRADIDASLVATLLWAQMTGVLQIAHTRSTHLKEHFQIEPDQLVAAALELTAKALKP